MTAVHGAARLRRWVRSRFEERCRALVESARTFARLAVLAARCAPGLFGLLALTQLILAGVPVAQVWSYKLLVDGVAWAGAPAFHPRGIWLAAGLYTGTLFLSQTAAAFVTLLDERLNERLQGAMRMTLLGIGERQSGLAFYEDEAVQNELETARRGLDYTVLEALSQLSQNAQKLILIATLSLLLARLHPLLPALLIATALPRFAYERRLSHYVWTGLTGRSPHWRWLNYCARVLYSVDHAKEVRLFGLGDFFLKLYGETFERAHQELVEIRRGELRGTVAFSLLNATVTGGAYAAIVLAAAGHRLTLGDVALYTGATYQLSGALNVFARSCGALTDHRLRLTTIFRLLDRPPVLENRASCVEAASQAEVQEASENPGGRGSRRAKDAHFSLCIGSAGASPSPSQRRAAPEIELRDVSFTYPGRAAPALRGINLRITPGEKIALVGENGAGKTTLLNLIARLYDPTEGEVLADGVPLHALDVRAWRRQLSNVSQEFLRLEAPLRANLAAGALSREGEDAALWAACEQVGVAEVVRALPGGLEQQLGKRFRGGVELSGGEWQKLAIARALLREEAGILLLDEPTSALDAPTEHAIFRQFLQLAEHRTTILISHRFSTVHIAERILVLEGGVIIEEGSHAALMARGGRYAELFELQAARYR